LSILKSTGFIIETKDGKWVNYLINPRPSDAEFHQSYQLLISGYQMTK